MKATPTPSLGPVRTPFSATYPILDLPGGAIHSVTPDLKLPGQFQLQAMANDGPLVVFSRLDRPEFPVLYLVDLRSGTSRELYRAPANTEIYDPVIGEGQVAWIEISYDMPKSYEGQHWWLKRLDLASGAVSTIAEGANPKLLPSSPGMAVILRHGGGSIAYGLADARDHWTIVVRSLASGEVLRTVALDAYLFDYQVDGTTVVFSEGSFDAASDTMSHLRLMTALPGQRPVLIARSAYYVGLDGGRVIWISDPKADAVGSGPPVEPQIVMAGLDGRDPVKVSRLADQHPTKNLYAPAAGDGFVAWWEDQLNPAGTEYATYLIVRDSRSEKTGMLLVPGTGIRASCSGGWLVWLEQLDVPSPVVRGLPVSLLSSAP